MDVCKILDVPVWQGVHWCGHQLKHAAILGVLLVHHIEALAHWIEAPFLITSMNHFDDQAMCSEHLTTIVLLEKRAANMVDQVLCKAKRR